MQEIDPENDTEEKERILREGLRALGNAAVAFSGGVDSTYLLKIAHEELGEHGIAVTMHGPACSGREMKESGRVL